MRLDNPDCECEQGLSVAGPRRDLVAVVVKEALARLQTLGELEVIGLRRKGVSHDCCQVIRLEEE